MNLKTKCQSTVKKCIVINRIQNNSFCLHNICVCHSGVKKFLPLPSVFFFFCIFVTLQWFRSSNTFLYYTKITRVNTKCSFEIMISFIKGKNCPNLPGITWKSNCPLNRITGCATFSSNNCNQTFAITGNEFFTSLWRNFDPLFFAELF